MATGGRANQSVDSRVACSVCLEPYRGRQPKLLPCFHTFCLPCLSKLALEGTSSQASGDATPATDKTKEKTATYSLICPTCRSVIPVPPGGVQHFQSNFYVEDEAYTNMEPAPGAKATEQNTVDDGDLQDKVKTQFKVMEAVLARLDEEEGEIIRQRRAMDHDIQTRYAAGLRYLADARDQCLISLRDAAQAAQDKLEVERTLAKMTHSALSPLMDPEQTSSNPSSPDTAQASLLNDATLRHFQQISQKKLEPKSYFSYCPSDSVTPSLTDSLGRFMGTVISDRTVRANDNFSKSSGSVDAEYMELRSPSANTGHDVTSVQPDIEKLEIKFQAEIDTLKEEMAGLKAKLSENVRLSQVARSQETDSATLTTDKADVSELEAEDEDDDPDFETIHHNIDLVKVSTVILREMLVKIKSDNSDLQRDVALIQKDIASLQQALVHNDSLGISHHPVAFHAVVGTGSGKSNSIVVLNKVVTNVGGGYDPNTGIFTAPVPGLYLFMANANPRSKGVSRFVIKFDQKKLSPSQAADANSCTSHAVVEMTAGQRVWMQSDGQKYCFTCNEETFFSGLLVKAKPQGP